MINVHEHQVKVHTVTSLTRIGRTSALLLRSRYFHGMNTRMSKFVDILFLDAWTAPVIELLNFYWKFDGSSPDWACFTTREYRWLRCSYQNQNVRWYFLGVVYYTGRRWGNIVNEIDYSVFWLTHQHYLLWTVYVFASESSSLIIALVPTHSNWSRNKIWKNPS